MAHFILDYTFRDNACVVIDGPLVTFWKGEGLPSYKGDMDGFNAEYPGYVAQLVKAKILVRTRKDNMQ